MTNPPTKPVAPLSESELAEIESRYQAASPSYCVDWAKGDHALLQASGWRPATEEQPRTIATFDRDDGYLDLLFCAEARTDIPALCQTVRAAWQWKKEALPLLKRYDDLADTFGGKLGSLKVANLERGVAALHSERARILQSLERAQQQRDNLLKENASLHERFNADHELLEKVVAERNGLRKQLAQVQGLHAESEGDLAITRLQLSELQSQLAQVEKERDALKRFAGCAKFTPEKL